MRIVARLAQPLSAGVVVLALVLAGCGDDGPSSAEDPEVAVAGAPYVTEDGELLVTCNRMNGWPVSVMAEGLPDVLTDEEADEILSDLLADPMQADEMQFVFLPDGLDTRWRVLRDDGDALTLGLGDWSADGPGAEAAALEVQHGSGGWVPGNGGPCSLRPELDRSGIWVSVGVAAPGSLERGTTDLEVTVTEVDECTGARDPRPHLRAPYLVVGAESVTVYWTSEPLGPGGATCPGNAPTPTTLTLEEPLGDRRLLDGSSYPPAVVGGTVDE